MIVPFSYSFSKASFNVLIPWFLPTLIIITLKSNKDVYKLFSLQNAFV